MIIYLSPCIFCDSIDCSHQSACLVSSDAEPYIHPFTFSNNLFIIKAGVHSGINLFSKVFDFMIALPDEAHCSIRGIGIAGTKPAVEPVTVFSDKTHKGIQSLNAGVCPLCTLFLCSMNFIQGRIDIHLDGEQLFGSGIYFVECLCIAAIKLPDRPKTDPPEEVAHGGGMGNISMSPYCFESLFFSQSKKMIKQ